MNTSTKIKTAAYLIIFLSVIAGCKSPSPPQTESLRIDGSSAEAYRASHVSMVQSLESNPPRLVSFLKGYFAAKLQAQKTIVEEDMKAQEKPNTNKTAVISQKRGERLEKTEMQILDGFDIEEVIEYGQVFEDSTGVRLIPSTQ